MPGPRSGTDNRTVGHFVLDIPSSVDSLPDARHRFAEWLDSVEGRADLSNDLSIVFSELAANAIDAAPDPSQAFRACAWQDGTELVLEVVNATVGEGRPAQRWDLDDPLRTGGRGLSIVQALCDTTEISHDGTGRLVVRCRCALDE